MGSCTASLLVVDVVADLAGDESRVFLCAQKLRQYLQTPIASLPCRTAHLRETYQGAARSRLNRVLEFQKSPIVRLFGYSPALRPFMRPAASSTDFEDLWIAGAAAGAVAHSSSRRTGPRRACRRIAVDDVDADMIHCPACHTVTAPVMSAEYAACIRVAAHRPWRCLDGR